MPIVFLGLGMAVFVVVPDLPDPDPLRYPDVAERPVSYTHLTLPTNREV